MKTAMISCVAIFVACFVSNAQSSFEELIRKFPMVRVPIDSVQFLKSGDTIAVKVFNRIFWELQPKDTIDNKIRTIRPRVYKADKLLDLMSFGKANEAPLNYRDVYGNRGKFYSKVFAIAKINLHKDFYALIVKEYDSELAHFDLYTFTKGGIRLSAVPLFTYVHDSMLVDSIDYVITRSSISKDGMISWLENNRGLKTSRVYKLRDDGYFEIVKETREGKFEY